MSNTIEQTPRQIFTPEGVRTAAESVLEKKRRLTEVLTSRVVWGNAEDTGLFSDVLTDTEQLFALLQTGLTATPNEFERMAYTESTVNAVLSWGETFGKHTGIRLWAFDRLRDISGWDESDREGITGKPVPSEAWVASFSAHTQRIEDQSKTPELQIETLKSMREFLRVERIQVHDEYKRLQVAEWDFKTKSSVRWTQQELDQELQEVPTYSIEQTIWDQLLREDTIDYQRALHPKTYISRISPRQPGEVVELNNELDGLTQVLQKIRDAESIHDITPDLISGLTRGSFQGDLYAQTIDYLLDARTRIGKKLRSLSPPDIADQLIYGNLETAQSIAVEAMHAVADPSFKLRMLADREVIGSDISQSINFIRTYGEIAHIVHTIHTWEFPHAEARASTLRYYLSPYISQGFSVDTLNVLVEQGLTDEFMNEIRATAVGFQDALLYQKKGCVQKLVYVATAAAVVAGIALLLSRDRVVPPQTEWTPTPTPTPTPTREYIQATPEPYRSPTPTRTPTQTPTSPIRISETGTPINVSESAQTGTPVVDTDGTPTSVIEPTPYDWTYRLPSMQTAVAVAKTMQAEGTPDPFSQRPLDPRLQTAMADVDRLAEATAVAEETAKREQEEARKTSLDRAAESLSEAAKDFVDFSTTPEGAASEAAALDILLAAIIAHIRHNVKRKYGYRVEQLVNRRYGIDDNQLDETRRNELYALLSWTTERPYGFSFWKDFILMAIPFPLQSKLYTATYAWQENRSRKKIERFLRTYPIDRETGADKMNTLWDEKGTGEEFAAFLSQHLRQNRQQVEQVLGLQYHVHAVETVTAMAAEEVKHMVIDARVMYGAAKAITQPFFIFRNPRAMFTTLLVTPEQYKEKVRSKLASTYAKAQNWEAVSISLQRASIGTYNFVRKKDVLLPEPTLTEDPVGFADRIMGSSEFVDYVAQMYEFGRQYTLWTRYRTMSYRPRSVLRGWEKPEALPGGKEPEIVGPKKRLMDRPMKISRRKALTDI